MPSAALDFVRWHLFRLCVRGSTLAAFLAYLACLDLRAAAWLNLMNLAASLLAGLVCGVVVYQLVWWAIRVARRWGRRDLAKDCRVRILGGPHRDRIVTVYDTWDSRGQLRVDLGPDAKRAVADVLMTYQVERVA